MHAVLVRSRMAREVCPGLYKDQRGKFYCRYAGGAEVDPAFMPCLLEYWECPYYQQAKKAEEAKPKAEEVVVPVEAKPPETPRETAAVAPAPPVAAEEHASLVSEAEALIERAGELARIWEEYDRAAREVVERWEDVRERISRELAGVDATITAYVDELERLEKMRESGVIGEEEYGELKASLERRLAEKNKEREELSRVLADLDRVVLPHFKRVKVAEVKPEIAKLKVALAKLEERFKSGGISEEVYEKLRSELEERIKRLEKIKEEVE